MKSTLLITTVLACVLHTHITFSAPSAPFELLVKYKPGAYSGDMHSNLGKIGWEKVKIDGSKNIRHAITALQVNPDIITVEPNYYGEFLSEPDDPDFDEQWYLPTISAPEAWDKSLGSGAVVGVVDSGVDTSHQDLADNILTGGRDSGDNDNDPTDEYGHGTQVCGVIAAVQNNGLGISGIAPKSKILPLKVSEGNSATFTASSVAEAIIYAADQGARIINLSLALGESSQAVTDAVEYAANKGVLLVAAAGHEVGSVRFPANLEDVIAVSATDDTDRFWSKSNQGPEIELSAPGKDIYTTALGDTYTTKNGTSFSSAMVSAAAALLIAKYPHLTGDQVKEYLFNSADDLGDPGKDNLYGYGKVNAAAPFDSLIPFIFPSTILGSSTIPLVYLLAVFGEGSSFIPGTSEVSFESAHLTPLGPPLIFLPSFLLQMVILESNPSEGHSDITVTTETEAANGYDGITIGLLPWNL